VSTSLLDKREERIRRMFDNIAPTYDFLNHVLSFNIDHYWRWRTTRMVPPLMPTQGIPAPILDLCTGTGDLALAYDRAAKGKVPIIGADFSSAMLARAETKVQKIRASQRIQLLEADAQQLPFPDNHFQIVTCAFGLRNVTDTDRGLAEMARVVQPGGRVAILEFSKPSGSIFGKLYRYYFRYLLPLVGQLISRSKDNAYRYLPSSVQEFDNGAALARRMEKQGLTQVSWHPLTFGIATLYVGTKLHEPDAKTVARTTDGPCLG
jgi:demethylmenaquinone methyltransferase/2-methoxy-6-polyprenyl-1,4-benzoquinol methylase